MLRFLTHPNEDPDLAREYPKGTKIYGRKGTKYSRIWATTTGHFKRCALDGCTGARVRVVWPDGQVRWLCTKGLSDGPRKGTYRLD